MLSDGEPVPTRRPVMSDSTAPRTSLYGRRASDPKWARLRTDVPSVLRRGAWYRVLAVTPRQVRLTVNTAPVLLGRDQVELRLEPPRRWTVLLKPARLARVPQSFHDGYLVCPSCRNRVSLPQRATLTMRCPRCNVLSEVGWDEHYLGEPHGVEVPQRD
jgi:hypothetical protein